MLPFLLDVHDLLADPGASVEVEGTYALDALVVGDESFTLTEPATVDVTVSNAGTGLVAHGHITAHVRAACARCLCEFDTHISGDVEGFYVSAYAQDADSQDAERVLSGGRIDIAPALIAALVIEAPFVPLHDPECAGLCLECGADLNEVACGCDHAPDDAHPFAVLRDLLADEQASNSSEASVVDESEGNHTEGNDS